MKLACRQIVRSFSTLIFLLKIFYHSQFYIMSHKLFVGKISQNTTEEQLYELFSKIGQVIHVHMTHKISFEPNNDYAYITMNSDEDAENAVTQLNNNELDGSRIKVTAVHKIDQPGHSYYSNRRRK